MLNQTVRPFKLSSTEEPLTAHAGLALFGEFCAAMKLSEQINRYLPSPGSAKGFKPNTYVHPLVLGRSTGIDPFVLIGINPSAAQLFVSDSGYLM